MHSVRNPFDVSKPYATTMRLALALAVLPGLGTGLLLVVIAGDRLNLPGAAGWPELAQGHGQVQALGFVLLFIIAVGLQLFPRFLGAPLLKPNRATWGAWTIASAVVARLVGQPLDSGPARQIILALSTLALPVGALVAGSAFHGLSRRSVQPSTGPSASWRSFIGVGGLALGVSLLLYVWAGLQLVSGSIIVPDNVDEALTHLELAGFATCIVFAVGSRIFGRFLLLRTRPAFERWLPILAELWGLGLLALAVGWIVDSVWLRLIGSAIEVCVLLAWLWLVGLYDAPARESGMPHITVPTRRWVRIAFAFLLLSVLLNTGWFLRDTLLGTIATSTELSAARHALAQGFLLPLMVSMASRLLPVFSAWSLKHQVPLEVVVDVLFVGAFVRVVAEAAGGYQPVAGPLVSIGGGLGAAAFTAFAIWLWASLGRLPSSSI